MSWHAHSLTLAMGATLQLPLLCLWTTEECKAIYFIKPVTSFQLITIEKSTECEFHSHRGFCSNKLDFAFRSFDTVIAPLTKFLIVFFFFDFFLNNIIRHYFLLITGSSAFRDSSAFRGNVCWATSSWFPVGKPEWVDPTENQSRRHKLQNKQTEAATGRLS